MLLNSPYIHPLRTSPSRTIDAVLFLKKLINFESVTPHHAGSMNWLSAELEVLGFKVDMFTSNGVTNLIATLNFSDGPSFAFAGHLDVVPATESDWQYPPFGAHENNGVIYGRGAADMKGAIAAMLSATKHWLSAEQNRKGTYYWLITSDEEGEALYGTKEIMARLANNGITLDACLVGEPTCDKKIGDTIKNGRRGAISGTVEVIGKSGHVAYAQNTINALNVSCNMMQALDSLQWPNDPEGSQTSLQLTNVVVPNAVDNVVPGRCFFDFNVRYSHGYSGEQIKRCVTAAIGDCGEFDISWQRPCEPYYTGPSNKQQFDLLTIAEHVLYHQFGRYPKLSTSGGTSDGRFIANEDTQVIEFGLRNYSIHQVNEHVSLDELDQVTYVYSEILSKIFDVN